VADPLAAASQEIELLRGSEADVVIVPGARGPVFVNIETPEGRIQRSPQVSDPVDPAVLPVAWRRAPAWMLAPVAAEIRDEWAAVMPAGALVGLGWQGLLRVLEEGSTVRRRSPWPSALVARADLVGVGRDDLDPVTTVDDLAALLHPGASLLLTNGVHGGEAIEVVAGRRPGAARRWVAIPAERYVDPVGAGDTFLAGVLAARLDPSLAAAWAGPDPDLRLGAACGSLVLEGPGLFGVPDRAAVLGRVTGEPASR
jgi:hypothetical protein